MSADALSLGWKHSSFLRNMRIGAFSTAVLLAMLFLLSAANAQTSSTVSSADLPNAPSALMAEAQTVESEAGKHEDARAPLSAKATPAQQREMQRCNDASFSAQKKPGPQPLQGPPPCQENPIQPIVTSATVASLTSNQKGELALRDLFDPFNFATIAAYSGIAIAANAHSAYGPGFKGFGKLTGYGMAQAAQVELFATYAVPSLLHQDPRYHRMPHAAFKRRFWHALAHTYVGRSDSGKPMPNYATLLTYPISAEVSNLYVPGVQTDAASTTKRIFIGIASDPAGSLVAEFLPDVAKRIHVHIVFVQEILNRMVVGAPMVESPASP